MPVWCRRRVVLGRLACIWSLLPCPSLALGLEDLSYVLPFEYVLFFGFGLNGQLQHFFAMMEILDYEERTMCKMFCSVSFCFAHIMLFLSALFCGYSCLFQVPSAWLN